jgi:hypothetical protein
VVALAVMTALMLIARPANEGSVPVEVTTLLPRTLTVVHAASVEPPSAPIRTARRPRAAGATTVAARPLPLREKVQAP